MQKRAGAIAGGLLMLAGCASGPEPYGPAQGRGDTGYGVQQIESDRLRVSYRARDSATARDYALRRAAEVTLDKGADWFRVVSAFSDVEGRPGGGTSVSVGGSGGSRGSSLGVGVGIDLSGGGRETVHDLEILIGSGPKPEMENVYDARSVRDSLGKADE